DAYSVATNKERSPEVHLFLEIPPDRVDVNVHPTKAEVRFRDQSFIHQVVRYALGDALGKGPAPELTLRPSDILPGRPTQPAIPGSLAGGVYTSRWAPGGAPVENARIGADDRPERGAEGIGTTTAGPHLRDDAQAVRPETATVRPMIPLGQFRDTFILAIDDEGICVIDQHVAHERVLFERIMQRLENEPLESQLLLVPVLLELPPAERQALMQRSAELARF